MCSGAALLPIMRMTAGISLPRSATGKIGAVTIEDCVAFKNGYVYDESGSVIDAGNGNGFKMGGSGISGHHVLKNSITYENKAKGH